MAHGNKRQQGGAAGKLGEWRTKYNRAHLAEGERQSVMMEENKGGRKRKEYKEEVEEDKRVE